MQTFSSIVLALWCLGPVCRTDSDAAHGNQAAVPHVRKTATISFVGDVMLGSACAALVGARRPDAAFVGIARTLGATDGVVGNLECTLSSRGKPTSVKSP